MFRMIIAAALLVSATAQADTKLGFGRTSEDKAYFDVNVNACVSAIRVEVKNTHGLAKFTSVAFTSLHRADPLGSSRRLQK